MSSQKKKDILLNAFNVLKYNYQDNYMELCNIVTKMSAIDLDTTLELWRILLKDHNSYLADSFRVSHLSGLTMIYGISENIGLGKVIELLKNNKDIMNACFKESVEIYYYIITTAIKTNELLFVNECLEMISNNHLKRNEFGEILYSILYSISLYPYQLSLSNKAVEMLLHWIQKIDDPEIRAKIDIALLDIVNE